MAGKLDGPWFYSERNEPDLHPLIKRRRDAAKHGQRMPLIVSVLEPANDRCGRSDQFGESALRQAGLGAKLENFASHFVFGLSLRQQPLHFRPPPKVSAIEDFDGIGSGFAFLGGHSSLLDVRVFGRFFYEASFTMRATSRRGLTVVELLVVVAIIGLVVALVLPAVQAAREASRRTTCENHLKQLGTAMANHEASYRRFPSGGWGFAWAGNPDRGTDRTQPGGWVFNILKFVDQGNLAALGKGQPAPQQTTTITLVVQTPLAIFNCPSRRGPGLAPFDPSPPPVNFNIVAEVAKSDYAVNAGDFACPGGPGPTSLAAGDGNYPWVDTRECSGICYLRSEVRIADIRDGASFTYLVGEKWATTSTTDLGDDQTLYSGYDYDTYRWGKPNKPPLPDGGLFEPDRFGSAHTAVCNFVFCDGSVHAISYSIDPEVNRRLANRADNLPVLASQF